MKQTTLVASPIYIGQARGEGEGGGGGGGGEHMRRGAKIETLSSFLFASFGLACPHASRMYFPLLAK